MDTIDIKAVERLQLAGRESWATLGVALGMTGPAAAERVRRLEADGVIRGYAAIVDPEAVGAGLTAFVAVSLERPGNRAAFLRRVARLAEIQECHHVAGDHDYLLKVRCAGTAELDRILTDDLKSVPGIVRTRTTVVLRTLKESVVVPLPDTDLVTA
ncbi:MAG TPA: Lrp/AsnC family transcriptional regulator [Gemmatimonadaceae bacterium]|nr:Lrp/AsnC family transcriptional regulator [Gemmatimonadaceae bacterium]